MTRGSVLKENYVLEENSKFEKNSAQQLRSPESPLFSQFYELEKFNMGAWGTMAHKVVSAQRVKLCCQRLFVEKSNNIRLSGLREIFFGKRLKNLDNVARYEEHLRFLGSKKDFQGAIKIGRFMDYFRDEGLSLQSYLYETRHMITTPSPFWRR